MTSVTLDLCVEDEEKFVSEILSAAYERACGERDGLKDERRSRGGVLPPNKQEDLEDVKRLIKAIRRVHFYFTGVVLGA